MGTVSCMDVSAAGQQIVYAVDDLALIATAAFFVPAAFVVALVVFAVVRDRRRSDDDVDADR